VTGGAATPSQNFERWALGLDAGLTLETPLGTTALGVEAFVASNYDRGLIDADPIESGFDLRHTAGYASVVQGILEYGLLGFRAGFYDPNSDVLEQTRGELVPRDQTIWTFSPLLGVNAGEHARVLVQYDVVRDHLGRDERGVPADVDNDQLTVRVQVEL
jgi:hypothetical protein